MANRNRIPFHGRGPFIARKANPIAGEPMVPGTVYSREAFASIPDRRLELLFEANWFDMAPHDYDGPVDNSVGPSHPLDRDGDGNKGGSLTDDELAALAAAGVAYDDWLKLPDPERADTLAAAVTKAAEAAAAADALEQQQAPQPPHGDGGEGGGSGSDPAAPVAIRAMGFGRYHVQNAAGEQIGPTIKGKPQAEAEAAKLKVPLKGKDEA